MERRDFIKLSALGLLPLIAPGCGGFFFGEEDQNYNIEIDSDMETGHLIMESANFPFAETLETDVLIVGGGIAGLSAACALKDKNFLLFELGNDFGGTSASKNYKGLDMCQGAHYDLAYPTYFGEECLKFLQRLDVLYFDAAKKLWRHLDERFIINEEIESQCFEDMAYRYDVLPPGADKKAFLEHLLQFDEKLFLPSRLAPADLRHYNDITFREYLENGFRFDKHFMRAVDYHMLDDFGSTSDHVSAFAGLYYYGSRLNVPEAEEVFSPAEGNHYFVKKLLGHLPKERLKTAHLVKKIEKNDLAFEVDVVDVKNKKMLRVYTKKVVYAGQKHALKHIYKPDAGLFTGNEYAPWLAINIVLNKDVLPEGFWQNEIIGDDHTFLGFVDSHAQNGMENTKLRILTAYYCFPPSERENMKNIAKNSRAIANRTVRAINEYFDEKINGAVEKMFFKVHGHGMCIPKPGFLFDDQNKYRQYPDLVYAGVDNARLPLFFEAVDSGMEAAKLLYGKEVWFA